MPRTIEIIVSEAGEVSIDAVGFKGADCERATAYLEQALGVIGKKVKKPEFTQRVHKQATQKVGG
jgi:Protein of unknown function (DUF2997)